MPERWVAACSLDETVGRPLLPVRVGGQQLLIVRDGEDLHCCERACPHEQADLAQGRCSHGILFCPRHLAWFRLTDGQVSPGWSFRPLRILPVRVADGQVLVDATGFGRASSARLRAD